MTPIAEQLIYNLRHDSRTREHFSIVAWDGHGTCETVGCLAGTAIFMEMGDNHLDLDGLDRLRRYFHSEHITRAAESLVKAAQRILGIEFYETAHDLFLPSIELNGNHFSYLPRQARPDISTFERWQAFISRQDEDFELFSLITPDCAAFALERIVKDEVPYCDWVYALENA